MFRKIIKITINNSNDWGQSTLEETRMRINNFGLKTGLSGAMPKMC